MAGFFVPIRISCRRLGARGAVTRETVEVSLPARHLLQSVRKSRQWWWISEITRSMAALPAAVAAPVRMP
ncbi:hypothetical protein Aca07nite_02950 [Actinoplanes capillaceus]|uniref:Uncharacterized protein n=1 Tax=Actinoplanes campanulatus TaxID=113559 RepID=A0ABQ3W9P8_9ACTN|nr:hypothetical protein Aca07nite_02950 [Actinoplanes capillaceus]